MRANTEPASPLRQAEAPDSVRRRESAVDLPAAFLGRFQQRGWRPRAHQLALLRKAADGAPAS